MNEVRLSAAQWREVCERVFRAWGAPDDIAACVARSLVESNLAGVDSHGVVRIGNYYNFVKPGWWLAAGRPQVAREGPCTAIIDGNWGFGQPAMHLGVDVGIAKARELGIAGIGVIRAGHIGRLGEYAEKAAAAGMLAVMGTSNARSGGHVVPYGGAERVFSTNPLAAGAPAAIIRRSLWTSRPRWWRRANSNWVANPTSRSRQDGLSMARGGPPQRLDNTWRAGRCSRSLTIRVSP